MTTYPLAKMPQSRKASNSDQKDYLRESLRRRLEEHRRDELLQIVAFLRTFNRYASDGLTVQEEDTLAASITPLYQTTVTKTVPVFSPVLVGLSDEQIRHLSKKIQSANREYREEYLDISRAERVRSRTQRTINRIETWTGALTPSQRNTVTEMTKVWPDAALEWYGYRLARQQDLLTLMHGGVAEEEIEAYLIAWWVNQTGRNPALIHKVDSLHADLKALIVTLDGSLSGAQRKHFTKRLDRLIETLEELVPADAKRNYAQLIDSMS